MDDAQLRVTALQLAIEIGPKLVKEMKVTDVAKEFYEFLSAKPTA